MPAVVAAIINWIVNPKNWRVLGIGVLVLALAGQTLRASHLKSTLVAARAALAQAKADQLDPETRFTWKSEYQRCDADRSRQNAALDAARADADRRTAELEARLQGASRLAKEAGDAAARILRTDLSHETDECKRLKAAAEAVSREYR